MLSNNQSLGCIAALLIFFWFGWFCKGIWNHLSERRRTQKILEEQEQKRPKAYTIDNHKILSSRKVR